VGEMLAMPQMLAYVAQISNPINRSAYMGYYTTCVALALMVGPLVGTALLEWDNQLCWHAATIVGLLALVGFYYLDRVDTARYSSEPQPEPHQLQVQENNCGSN
jgi:MFS family permease